MARRTELAEAAQARRQTLAEELGRHTREGELYDKVAGNRVRCHACGHRCLILDGHEGICRVRYNRDGVLYVPHGYAAAIQCDPIEKKPFFHAWPGTLALSFGMLGCDLHCGYCQNWLTSQTLRDPASEAPATPITPSEVSALAREHGASTVTSTYNEPLITSEWAVAIFREARRHGLRTSYVSNGNGTPAVLEYLRPWVDLYKVDLKSFDDRRYRQLGGKLETVLDTIRLLWEMGFWVEIVTLVVPGFNDREEELRQIARFLAGVSKDIPWHLTAFHPDYQMQERGATPERALLTACALGKEAGLHYVYAGNIPGAVDDWENTRCPQCTTMLIERSGFQVRSYHITEQGTCPKCGTAIAGRWDASLTRAALERYDSWNRIPRVVRRW